MAWGTEDQGGSRTEKGTDRSAAACGGPRGQAEGAQGVRAAGRAEPAGAVSWSRRPTPQQTARWLPVGTTVFTPHPQVVQTEEG